jgi:hypothetical protein
VAWLARKLPDFKHHCSCSGCEPCTVHWRACQPHRCLLVEPVMWPVRQVPHGRACHAHCCLLAETVLLCCLAASCCRLSKVDQERVFPNSVTFDSPQDQEAFVKEWAQKRTGLACDFKVCAGASCLWGVGWGDGGDVLAAASVRVCSSKWPICSCLCC